MEIKVVMVGLLTMLSNTSLLKESPQKQTMLTQQSKPLATRQKLPKSALPLASTPTSHQTMFLNYKQQLLNSQAHCQN
ncbi:unnamed protein product [Blepharisma stoltei]|uniref:Uncharacterized protein n=1 Tax=Blepharisma stoltei TaxID=1481888 RepID=A0AAU9JTI0_9CILI|nr:unnamed protein product [Blepharisma stoltei]